MGLMQKQFADLITFTRPTGGGRFNAAGQFEWLPANTPRIDYDPATLSLSTSSVTLGAGQHTFATTRLYTAGDVLRASADANNWMIGRVVAASAESVTIEVASAVTGSGTYSSWTLIVRLGILVEEQRTNLLTYSSDFANAAWTKYGSVVPSDTFGPDGTTKMFAIVELESAGWHGVQKNQPAATGSRTVSVFAKKGRRDWLYMRSGTGSWGAVFFNLSTGEVGSRPSSGNPASASGIEDIGGGIYRCWATFPNTDTVPIRLFSSDVDGNIAGYVGEAGVEAIYIWGAQLEAGSFPTSLIHTTNAQVTRTPDIATVNELSPWYNASEGTLFVEAVPLGIKGDISTAGIVSIDSASTAERFQIRSYQANGSISGGVAAAGTLHVLIEKAGALEVGKRFTTAFAGKANDFAMYKDGLLVGSDQSGPMPAPARMAIGFAPSSGYFNGHIRSIRYYPKRLSGSELQAMTA